MSSNKGQLIVYSGPSGVGKGTILSPLLCCEGTNLILSVSATTRAPRTGEVEGIHYHFVAKDEFLGLVASNQMLEYAQYSGNFYGTPKSFVEQKINEGKNVVLEIEVQGAMKIKECFPEALFIFVMPPSYEELRRRLFNRQTETAQQLEARLETAVSEMKYAKEYDFVIVNQDVDDARESLMKAIKAGPLLARLNTKIINEVQQEC